MANGKITLGKQSGGTLGLVFPDGIGNTEVMLPESGNLVSVGTAVTDNAIARYDGTTGKLQNSGVVIDDSGNVGIGTNNPSSSLTLKDGLTLVRQFDNNTPRPAVSAGIQKYGIHTGDYSVDDGFLRLSAGGGINAYGKSYIDISAYSNIPDMSRNIVFGVSGTEMVRIDAYGNLLLKSGAGALGYGAGAGGTVTQLISKSTNVTLNKPSGTIITNGSALAAGATVYFAFFNSVYTNTYDIINFQLLNNDNSASYNIWAVNNGPGFGFIIFIKNISASSLSDVLQINFSLVKGAVA